LRKSLGVVSARIALVKDVLLGSLLTPFVELIEAKRVY